MKSVIALLFGLLALPALAGEDSLQDMTLEEWQDLALGRTLTYRVGGEFYALERYARSGNQVELQFFDGTCVAGHWTHAGNLFCFDYGHPKPHCFRHVRSGNQILVIGFVDGLETGDVQEMSEVTDAPLNCGQNLS